MDSLTHFQRDILTVATGLDEPHGLAIKAELEAAYGTDVNHGRLYPNLDSLVNQGLLEKGTIDRRTNSYTITDKGREWLARQAAWERQYTGDIEAEAPLETTAD